MTRLTFAEAIRSALREEMRRDPDVFLLGEDIGVYQGIAGVTGDLLTEFGPERVMDTPISETAYVGCAIGAAITGMKPVAELQSSDFAAVCFDQLINQAAKYYSMYGGQVSVPLVVRAASGGGTGAAAQHSQSLEVLFAHIPGLKVVMPATPCDAKGLLKSAIRDPNPIIFLEPRLLYPLTGDVPSGDYTIPLGQAEIKREGADLSVITYGNPLHDVLALAEEYSRLNVSIEVLDLRTLMPLDLAAIEQTVRKTGRVLIVHEAVEFAGFGAEIAAQISQTDLIYKLRAPILRVGSRHTPLPFHAKLEQDVLPNRQRIKASIERILETNL